MKKIAIYGAGGFGREIACLINILNEVSREWDIIGFFDDGIPIGTKNEYGEVLGGIQEINSHVEKLALVIAIASPKAVEKIVQNIKAPNVYYPNIIAPDVIFLDKRNVRLGKGNILCSGCLLSCNVTLGSFNILNGFYLKKDLKNFEKWLAETDMKNDKRFTDAIEKMKTQLKQ